MLAMRDRPVMVAASVAKNFTKMASRGPKSWSGRYRNGVCSLRIALMMLRRLSCRDTM
ncbi:hypothetical protein D3C72_2154760 [compost metagenome]